MNSNKTTLAVAGLIAALTVSVIGTSAYTLFTAERGANIDVVSDDTGILELGPGSSSYVYQTNGELTINVSAAGADGVNVNSTLDIGNTSEPTVDYAFNVTNNDGQQRNITLSYNPATNPSSGDEVQYRIYDDTGTHAGTTSEETDATVQIPSRTTYYVVVKVDTLDASTADDLSGTLSISAE